MPSSCGLLGSAVEEEMVSNEKWSTLSDGKKERNGQTRKNGQEKEMVKNKKWSRSNGQIQVMVKYK